MEQTGQVLESKELVERLKASNQVAAAARIDAGVHPHLAVILVGQDPSSVSYVAMKEKQAKQTGVTLSIYHLEEDCTKPELEQTVQFLAQDSEVHGMIIQLPLPARWSNSERDQLFALIPPNKDVDGLTKSWEQRTQWPLHTADLLIDQEAWLPPMVLAVLSLLDQYQIDPSHGSVVMVGEGVLVGGPVSHYLAQAGCQIQSVNEETEDVLAICKTADLLICGTGHKQLITHYWVKPGAVVLDCASDVHFDSVVQIAKSISPAKGGLGPLTVQWLLHNTIQAAI